jgi:amino acid adenylation domain-containing protein
MVPRSEWYLLCALGILKTGAAYVPIDTSYPDERISFMISDSSSKAVLATPETAERISVLCPCHVIDCTSCSSATFPILPVSHSDTAIVLYTSGSTGNPKGAAITRRAIDNVAEWYVSYTGMDSSDVYSMYTAYTFDMHVLALFPALICGARLDIVPEDIRLDMHALNDHFVRVHATHTFMTTHLGRMFADLDMHSDLRFLLFIGEKLGEYTAPDWIGACESYGPTESLALVSAISVNERTDPSSVGRLLPNVRAYILDQEHRRVPVGAVGELYLSGYQLSTGYLNNPEKNAEAFFDNPFSEEPGYERMYATGDFFRLLPDGTLGIIGRRDGQVKIRGNRVELTEVEVCIRSMPGIEDVTVQPITWENGSKELCAYVVADSSSSVSAESVQSYVAERKPDYMVPDFVITIGFIPLNVNGKVDRRRLPKPDMIISEHGYVEPIGDGERLLCEALERALGLERVGVKDDFLRLGGDSLKAIMVAAYFNSRSDLHIAARDVLRRRNVIDILANSDLAVGERISYNQKDGHRPTRGQGDMARYIIENRWTFNLPMAVPLSIGVSAEHLAAAFRELVRVTPSLRMRLVERDGEPWVLYDGEPEIRVVREDPMVFKDTFVTPFDIYGKDLMRVAFVEWGGECWLLINFCHLVIDGPSFAPFIERFKTILAGGEVPMDEGILRQAEFDHAYLRAPRYPRRVKEYVDMLRDSDDYLPDRPGGPDDPGTYQCLVSMDVRKATSVSAELGCGIADLLYCAFAHALKAVFGREKLFYVIEGGRDEIDVSGAIGMFSRLHPIWVCADSEDPYDFTREALKRIDAIMEYSDVTLLSLWKERHIWPDIVMHLNNFQGMGGYGKGIEMGRLTRSPFRIHMLFAQTDTVIALRATYSEDQSIETVKGLSDEVNSFLLKLADEVELRR